MKAWTRTQETRVRGSEDQRPFAVVEAQHRKRAFRVHDPVLLGAALLASVMGLIFVFDAGYARSMRDGYGAIPREFLMQILFLGGAAVLGFFASRARIEAWERLARPIWIVTLLALVAVLFVGLEMNGARRWFKIGPITVQPAEFAKIAVVLYLAAVFARRKAWPKKVKMPRSFALKVDAVYLPKLRRALPAVWVGLALVLIELEPDLGTGFIAALTAFALLWAGGVTRRSLLWCAALSVVAVVVLVQIQPYRFERITTHFDRWSPANIDGIAYQTVQSELAMASGGLFGVGMGLGRAKHVMPAATTDFITSTVGEEFGLLGWLAVAAVLGVITWRLILNAQRAQTKFAQLVLLGFGAWIGCQTVINLMMANGTMPAIGIPLPFISSGGSSLVALWMALGISEAAARAKAPAKDRLDQSDPVDQSAEQRVRPPGAYVRGAV